MPRRLAPLLFLLYIVLTHATTKTSDNTQPPVKDIAVPLPDVFIPLKEWKRQRLQHLESRVRKEDEKLISPRRRLSAVCKPRARLLAFLARVDVCPPSTPLPTTPPNASSHDPHQISGQRAYADVKSSTEPTETAPPKLVQPAPKPAVSPIVVEQSADSTVEAHVKERVEVASVEPTPDTTHHERKPVSVEEDELTGRIEDFIPKVLPKVLPNVIPRVGEFVESIKEVSLAYATSGDAPPDSFNRSSNGTPAGSTKGNSSTCNVTSEQPKRKKSRDEKIATSESGDPRTSPKPDKDATEHVLEDQHMRNIIVKHSNDSGVKEKPFNYASIDAGARVLAFSDGAVGATNVIQGSNDKYLLAPCAGSGIVGSRFVDLELSEDVILESIETGNFEYYSSSPRRIAVLGASAYPPKKWNVLGIYDFANVKTLQRFQIEKRGVTRYLRVIFAGKQGTEYYCPISTIRAFGKNLLADWKEVLEKPAAPRKPVIELAVGSKTKTEKESDRSKHDNGRNPKRVERRPSENTARCSGDSCKDAKETSTVSASPTALPKGTLGQEKHEARLGEDVKIQSDETKSARVDVNVQDGNDTTEDQNRTGDDSSESDVTSEGKKNVGEKSASDGSVTDEDNSDTSQTNYDDSDHVSEDDQVVIDALRSDTLSPVDGDDNIFRKVTRMLRLLELNQTLTNQYIDTQLAKFAKALSGAHSSSRNASERVEMLQRQLEIFVVRLENQVEELTRANFRRDVLLCVLLVCVAFLLGTHWILWSAVSATRLHEETGIRRTPLDSEMERVDRLLQADEVSHTAVTRLQGISSEGPSPIGRKKKKKGRRPFAGENMNGGYFSGSKLPPANGLDSGRNGRSLSSFEISVNGKQGFGSTGGTFDVLRRMADQ